MLVITEIDSNKLADSSSSEVRLEHFGTQAQESESHGTESQVYYLLDT